MLMPLKQLYKYTVILVMLCIASVTTIDANASVICAKPTYGTWPLNVYATCGGENNCECECPHIETPGESYSLLRGQQGTCFEGETPYAGLDDPAPIYCIGVGTPAIDCVGEDLSPDGDITWLQPPVGYSPPSQPVLGENFWKSFFEIAVPGSGHDAEENISGPLSNVGLDDPEVDLYLGSQYKFLPFCAKPRTSVCFDFLAAKRSNCAAMPKGHDGQQSTFQSCMGNNESDFLDCLTDLDTPGRGPWDAERMRDQGITPNAATYMEDAITAAKQQANTCIEERYLSMPPFEGVFDELTF